MGIKLGNRQYFEFLFVKWKIATFVVAYFALLIFGHFAGDPTWDFYSVSIMSTLTFLTAAWSVGVLARAILAIKRSREVILALFFWFLSTSTSYDIYVYLKTGYKAEASVENFLVSSCFYVLAGLFWSLSANTKKSFFSFRDKNWPKVEADVPLKGLMVFGLPLAAGYLLILLGLVYGV